MSLDDIVCPDGSDGFGPSLRIGGRVLPPAATAKFRQILALVDAGCACYVCQDSLAGCGPEDVTLQLGTRQPCHKACYNGHRSLKSMLSNIAEAMPAAEKESIGKLHLNDPDRFRAIAMCLVTQEANTRTQQLRSQVRSWVEELVRETRVTRKQRVLLLSQNQYIAWHGLHEGMSAADTMTQWLGDVANPAVYREQTPSGKVYLAVSLPTELAFEESVAKKRKLRSEMGGLSADEGQEKWASLQQGGADSAQVMGSSGLRGMPSLMPGASSTSTMPPSSFANVGNLFGSMGSHHVGGGGCATPRQSPATPGLVPPVVAAPVDAAEHKADQADAANDGQGGDADTPQASPKVSMDMIENMNLPKFLKFKQALKAALVDTVRAYSSPVKGKTYGQVVTDAVAKGSLDEDPEFLAMGASDLVAKVDKHHKELMQSNQKAVALWSFNKCKGPDFKVTAEGILNNMAEFYEGLEELKQMYSIVKDVKLGMKRQAATKRRQENQKVNKLLKVMKGNGVQDRMARIFGKVLSNIQDGEDEQQARAAWMPASSSVAGLLTESTELGIWQCFRKSMEEEEKLTTINQKALATTVQMKHSSIMVPVAVDKSFQEEAISTKFVGEGYNDVCMRPWLVIGQAMATTAGPMRWPLPGVGCMVYSMDSHIVLAIANIQTMLSKAVSTESHLWLPGEDEEGDVEGKLKDTDLAVIVLKKGEGCMVPFGHLVQWVYNPDKPTDVLGKLLVQPLLESDMEVPASTCKEVKHACEKLLAAHGTSGPWAKMKAGLESFMGSLKAVDA